MKSHGQFTRLKKFYATRRILTLGKMGFADIADMKTNGCKSQAADAIKTSLPFGFAGGGGFTKRENAYAIA
jgi:hypothetical protein